MGKNFILIAAFILSALACYAQNDQLVGPTAGTVGNTSSYYYQSTSPDEFYGGATWSVVKGTVISSSINAAKTRASATIRWDLSGAGSVTLVGGYGTKNVTVSCPTMATPTFSAPTICGSIPAALTATPGSGGNTIRWYNAASGGTKLYEGTSYNVTLSSNTTYYISSAYGTSTCESARVAMNVTVNAALGSASASNQNGCAGFPSVLTATPGTNANSIRWYNVSTGGSPLASPNTSYTTPALTQNTTFYAESFNTTTGCQSPSRTAVTVTVATAPSVPSGIADEVIYGSGSVTIHAVPHGGDQVKWYTQASGGSAIHTGASYTTPALTASAQYYIETYNSTTACPSVSRTPVTVTVSPLISPSAIITEIIRVADIKQDGQIYALTADQKSRGISYYDGLLRVHQQVSSKASPQGYDIVSFAEYDAQGRSSKTYLPYVAATTNGSLQQDFMSAQLAFYSASGDKIANDANPYAQALFEESPLGRVLESGSVGAAWQPGTSHTQRFRYTFNVANEVRLFKPDGTSTSFFSANTLNKTELTDENGNNVVVFTNSLGQTLLKKIQLDEVIDSQTVDYLETYYIYDDFGRMKYTISPKGVAALQANSWSLTQSIIDQYVYEYKYDNRGRVAEKKVPGSAWTYYGYDDLNRLVLMQDGLLRGQNKWLFIKYDQKHRPVMQGLYRNTVNVTRSSVQTILDGLYTSSNPTFGVNAWFETRGSVAHGYTNTSFPKTNQDNSALEVLSLNYYDNYDFDNSGTADYSYQPGGQGRSRGLSTGSKRLVLGTGTWLYTYVFYDEDGRVIQVRSDNHLSPTREDLVTMEYDFEGKLLERTTYHKAGAGNETTVLNTFEYDAQGRLVKVYQKNNTDAQQLVAKYEYNELGQLVDKKLHNTGGENYLQSVDYRYTIRGQLASINNSQLTINNDNDETDDYFGMELLYNTVEAGLSNTAYYNGNISAVKWKGVGAGSGATDQKSYAFAYDKTGRLEAAASQMYSGSDWTKEAGAFNEAMSYDHNGNIKTLARSHRKHELTGIVASYTAETIDNLSYTYDAANGNSLKKVEDAVATTTGKGDFKNTVNQAEEYTYDLNGNLTADKNKGISKVVYNILGKADSIKFTDGRAIAYTYDAAGTKLKMIVTEGGNTTITDYAAGFVYENGNLSFFGSPEGRVVKNGSSLEYQYSIADHQGNTRVVFTSATPAPQSTSADFESSTSTDFQNYSRVNFELMDRTDFSGSAYSYSQKLTGGNNSQIGVTKSLKVYPGDKVKIEAYAKYYNPQGTQSNLPDFALALTSAFGVSSASTGEALNAYNSLDAYGSVIAAGSGGGSSSHPKLFVNILLFDKDHNFLDAAWEQIDGGEQVGATPKEDHDYMMQEVTVTEEGYAYVYISNENPTLVEFYVDDVTVTHTPGNVVQYNEYYPFGLQAGTSWTRENNSNNFLYNRANELNANSGWYEMFFRGYDPALGRMLQVDPMATSCVSYTPYNYSFNNPVLLNDPSGAYPAGINPRDPGTTIFLGVGRQYIGHGSGNHWTDQVGSIERNAMFMSQNTFGSFYQIGNNQDRANVAQYAAAQNGIGTQETAILANAVGESLLRGYYLMYGPTAALGKGTQNEDGSVISDGLDVIMVGEQTHGSGPGDPFSDKFYIGLLVKGDYKDISDEKNYPGVKIYESRLAASGAITLPGIGIFVHPGGGKDVGLLQHEYGHYLDYKFSPDLNSFGTPSATLNFYLTIGLPSIFNAATGLGGDHGTYWTEIRANQWAQSWFGDKLSPGEFGPNSTYRFPTK